MGASPGPLASKNTPKRPWSCAKQVVHGFEDDSTAYLANYSRPNGENEAESQTCMLKTAGQNLVINRAL